jgi:hypothetical protein
MEWIDQNGNVRHGIPPLDDPEWDLLARRDAQHLADVGGDSAVFWLGLGPLPDLNDPPASTCEP